MVSRPGADSVNNALGHQHPEQPPSSTYGHQHPGQPPSSTSLGADSIVNVLSQQHRSGQHPSSTYSVNSTARGSPRHQRMVTSTQGSPRHQRRLDQTPSSATQRAQ